MSSWFNKLKKIKKVSLSVLFVHLFEKRYQKPGNCLEIDKLEVNMDSCIDESRSIEIIRAIVGYFHHTVSKIQLNLQTSIEKFKEIEQWKLLFESEPRINKQVEFFICQDQAKDNSKRVKREVTSPFSSFKTTHELRAPIQLEHSNQ